VLVGDVGFLVRSLHLVNDLLEVAHVFPSTLRNSCGSQVSFLLDECTGFFSVTPPKVHHQLTLFDPAQATRTSASA
jgi:hypothetical protein